MILFHADVAGLTGGFIGVDVFFVISGYLISQRILYPRQAGVFSYRSFYIRRIRRLFPAMLSTTLLTLGVGSVLLPPELLANLATSAMAAVLSVVNFKFFLAAGYWDQASTLKPLLHTWSLAVEEQFYLAWPLLLSLVFRQHRRDLFRVLTILTLCSLALTYLLTPRMPAAAFYLTPFRIYEFLIGALCIRFDGVDWSGRSSRNGWRRRVLQKALWLIGLGAILVAALTFDEQTDFPGAAALLPTLGTAMVIVAHCRGGLGYLLANPLMRSIGLVSYSLYLVHWPVFVFVRWQGGDLQAANLAVALGLTAVLAWLQYRFIEQKFRRPDQHSGELRRVLAWTLLAAVLVLGTAAAVLASKGLSWRYDQEFHRLAELSGKQIHAERKAAYRALCARRSGSICGRLAEGRVNVLIVGDSLAADGLNILQAGFPGANYLISQEAGCPLLADLTDVGYSNLDCAGLNEQRFADLEVLIEQVDVVVLSQRLSQRRLPATKALLQRFALHNEWLVFGAGPQFDRPVLPAIQRYGLLTRLDEVISGHFRSDLQAIDQQLQPFVEQLGGRYLPRQDFFCPQGRCRILISDGIPLMIDERHLTRSAARALGAHLAVTYPDLLSRRSALPAELVVESDD